MAAKKIHTVKQEWNHFSLPTRLRFVRGTAEQLAEYYGIRGLKAPTIRSVVSRAQKSYERREACCYGRTSIDVVTDVPEGARVSDLTK